jgi:protein phosphatase 1G
VLVFNNENYWVANSGDSRSALSRGGKLVVLSEDHKPESEIERKRIEKAGGIIMNGRVNGGLNLTRAIGEHLS